ncbi:MAG: cytochrome c oxidase subunit II [Pirellulaceae bacterium]
MNQSFQFFPEAASRGAVEVDYLSFALLAICLFFTIGIFAAILVFGFRYWHTREVDRQFSPSRRMHWIVELTWSLGPLAILIALFIWGAVVYVRIHRPPDNPLEVNVVAKQWMWKIAHPNGRREINSLHVPTGRPVRLTMISEDVIHSFFVPAFRAKQDVLPGRYTTIWWEPTKPGRYRLFCAEYCGTSHSQMIGEIVVQSPEDYSQWAAAEPSQTLSERGQRHVKQLGCLKCHRAVAGTQTGPSLTGMYGSSIPLSDGTTIIADADYVRQSIIEPMKKVHDGFKPTMPSYAGQIESEALLEIVAYLRSLEDVQGD